jgi:hypothetical protein
VQLAPQTHASTLTGGNGRIVGSVLDASGATLAGATVRLMDENNVAVAQTMSNSQGQYSFADLPAGRNYNVEIASTGFKKNLTMGINVGPGDNTLNSQLQVGTVSETVNVMASNSSLSTESAGAASAVGGKLGVARRAHVGAGVGAGAGGSFDMPMNGKQFMSLSGLSPGTLDASREAAGAAASGGELGDLFEYKLKDKVTLKKNQSALVPIAQTEIEAEKISLWSGTSGSGRPLRGLWLKNTSSLTLDGGSFSVLENEVFAGEGLTEAIKPGERRLVTYATDLGLLVEAQGSSAPQQVRRAKISKGVMTQTSELRESTTYTVRNQDETPRTLVIEHPARPEWRLANGSREPDERTLGMYRFRVDTLAKASASLPVEEVRTLETTYELTNINEDQIGLFLQQRTISTEMAQALRKITAQKAVVAGLEQEMESRQHDIDRIVDDQARLRENMKALKGSAEEKALIQRYTHQLDEQETRLDDLRNKIEATEARRDNQHEELDRMIAELDLEVTL